MDVSHEQTRVFRYMENLASTSLDMDEVNYADFYIGRSNNNENDVSLETSAVMNQTSNNLLESTVTGLHVSGGLDDNAAMDNNTGSSGNKGDRSKVINHRNREKSQKSFASMSFEEKWSQAKGLKNKRKLTKKGK